MRRGKPRLVRALNGFFRFLRAKPLSALGVFILTALVVSAILAPLVAPYDPYAIRPRLSRAAPSAQFLLGTDLQGRDLLSRIIFGGRISLGVGLTAIGLATLIGATLGVVSAWYGGRVDLFLQRFVDILQAFPSIVLAMAIIAVLGADIRNVAIAIGITRMPSVIRVIRGVALSIKENQYIEASRAIGAGNLRIMSRHILPNVMAPITILVTILIGSAIISEASLSFLGLGAQPPTPSWGQMLSGASQQYLEQSPHLAIFPGLAITLTVFAFNVLGDGLRDVLDPRLRGSR
ncbi:MAG: ABC transporter permease [Chloroflexi bacterium]|nr:ABC transporter permease [Chloroflexota bacterium]